MTLHHPPQVRPVPVRSAAALLLIAVLLVVSAVVVTEGPASTLLEQAGESSGQTDQVSGGLEQDRPVRARRLATDLRLVNYYPQDRAWEQQWTRFSESVTARDFARIRGLGATSVRIILFPKVHGYPRPDAEQQRHLRTVVDLAEAAGLQVWLTLFDNFSSYTDLTGSRTWTTAVLTPYADDPRIAAVEVRNEIKTTNDAAMVWARDQVTLIHQLIPALPVTLSLNGAVDPTAYATLLTALHPQAPDLISYHYYGDPGLAYDHVRRVIDAVGTIPVVIGEAGWSTSPAETRCSERACREAEQVDWYRIVVAAARQAGLAPPAPWTVFDLDPDATVRPLTAIAFGYGLFRTDGTVKPAAAVVTDAFADRWTTNAQDTDFSEPSMQGTRARGWVPWRITGSFRVEDGAGVGGAAALAVSGTETLETGVSAWYARPLHAVRAGQTWRVRVYARGVEATGTNALAVVWLDGEGEYIGQRTSAKLTVSGTGWQTLTVDSVPPPGAGAVRIHLRSAGNTGTVYFSSPDWTVTG